MSEAPDLPPYYRLVSLDSVDSTNEEAKRLARRGGDTGTDGTVVWARSQTAGRGRAAGGFRIARIDARGHDHRLQLVVGRR